MKLRPILWQSWHVAVLAVAAWSLVHMTVVAASDPESRANAETPAEKILKALNQTISVEFSNQPLDQVLDRLKEQTKLKLVLDLAALEQAEISDEGAKVTVKLEKTKARAALQSVLNPFNLTYVILGDMVLITSEESAIQRQMRQRISVDLDNTPLQTALKQLARQTASNLVVDGRTIKDAQQPVSLKVDDVPLEVAVRLLADMAGLRPVRVGNVMYVTTKVNATELRASLDSENHNDPGVGLGNSETIYETTRSGRVKAMEVPKRMGGPVAPKAFPAIAPVIPPPAAPAK